jgi:hypothetical protein
MCIVICVVALSRELTSAAAAVCASTAETLRTALLFANNRVHHVQYVVTATLRACFATGQLGLWFPIKAGLASHSAALLPCGSPSPPRDPTFTHVSPCAPVQP